MESNWTDGVHATWKTPLGHNNEPEMIKKLYKRITKQEMLMHGMVTEKKESDQVDKHVADHLKMENTILNSKFIKQKHLIEDLKDLVDMFATGNVDLKFYKRVIKDYLNSIEKS